MSVRPESPASPDLRPVHELPAATSEVSLDRRHLLILAGTAAVTACSGDPAPAPADAASDLTPPGDTSLPGDVGDGAGPCGDIRGRELTTLAALPVGAMRGIRLNSTLNFLVGRDARGVYAVSAICTHTACTLPEPADVTATIRCNCHFSEFTPDGVVQPGSRAVRDLQNFALRVCDGRVWVLLDEVNRPIPVSMGTRTPAA